MVVLYKKIDFFLNIDYEYTIYTLNIRLTICNMSENNQVNVKRPDSSNEENPPLKKQKIEDSSEVENRSDLEDRSEVEKKFKSRINEIINRAKVNKYFIVKYKKFFSQRDYINKLEKSIQPEIASLSSNARQEFQLESWVNWSKIHTEITINIHYHSTSMNNVVPFTYKCLQAHSFITFINIIKNHFELDSNYPHKILKLFISGNEDEIDKGMTICNFSNSFETKDDKHFTLNIFALIDNSCWYFTKNSSNCKIEYDQQYIVKLNNNINSPSRSLMRPVNSDITKLQDIVSIKFHRMNPPNIIITMDENTINNFKINSNIRYKQFNCFKTDGHIECNPSYISINWFLPHNLLNKIYENNDEYSSYTLQITKEESDAIILIYVNGKLASKKIRVKNIGNLTNLSYYVTGQNYAIIDTPTLDTDTSNYVDDLVSLVSIEPKSYNHIELETGHNYKSYSLSHQNYTNNFFEECYSIDLPYLSVNNRYIFDNNTDEVCINYIKMDNQGICLCCQEYQMFIQSQNDRGELTRKCNSCVYSTDEPIIDKEQNKNSINNIRLINNKLKNMKNLLDQIIELCYVDKNQKIDLNDSIKCHSSLIENITDESRELKSLIKEVIKNTYTYSYGRNKLEKTLKSDENIKYNTIMQLIQNINIKIIIKRYLDDKDLVVLE